MSQGDLVAQWERVQINTFTKWCNMHLAKKGQKIDSILTDFKDGVRLIQLLEIIGEDTIPRYIKAPKLRLQMIENVGKALKFIADHKVNLANIGAEAIVDGNRTLTLGMIWTVILRFAIQGLSQEGISAKQGLLLWCQKKTEGYKGVNVLDFQDSFKDGLAFCALIHKHRPDLLDFDSLTKENPRANLDLAFDVAAKHLGIPKLLDTDDIVNMPKPDERSVMTYCAALYNVFSSYDKVGTAGRRVAKFVNFLRTTEEMLHDYEARAKELQKKIDGKIKELAAKEPGDSYTAVRANIATFKEYKIQQKRKWVAEQADLEALFANIQSKLKSLGRPPYVPPETLAPPSLDKLMDDLTSQERKYRGALNSQMKLILDTLRKAFAEPANAFFTALQKYRAELVKPVEGDLEHGVHKCEELSKQLGDELEQQLPIIKAAEDACLAANIEDNEYSDHLYEDLQYAFDQLRNGFSKKIIFLQTQIAEAKGGVTPEKLNEFRESFAHFDVDNDGLLARLEARSCLASLGVISVDFGGKDTEFEKIFAKIAEGKENVTFDQYVRFMVSITEETVSPQQLAEAMDVVTGNKDFVTEADLAKAGLNEEQIAYLKSTMPPSSLSAGAFDHKKWLSSH